MQMKRSLTHTLPLPGGEEEQLMKRKYNIIPYDQKLKERARYLRNHSTRAEVVLWKYLRNKQMLGYDFDRQKPIDHYIVDFYCKKLRLAVEIDGESHVDKWNSYDKKRDHRLQEFGVTTLRFRNEEVLNHINDVLMTIEEVIKTLEKE